MVGGGSNGQFQQVTPRYFVDIEQTESDLEVTFKLTPPTPVRFKMFDADTGEDLFSVARGYPEVFVRIDDKWWILALFDSSGQHNFAPVVKSMEGHTFRAEAPGYKPKIFEVTGLMADGIEHRVELQRLDERKSPSVTEGGNETAAVDSWKRFKVGDTAANMIGLAADGSYYDTKKSNAGQFILVSYWSTKDKNYEKALEAVERIFQRHGHRDDFHIKQLLD